MLCDSCCMSLTDSMFSVFRSGRPSTSCRTHTKYRKHGISPIHGSFTTSGDSWLWNEFYFQCLKASQYRYPMRLNFNHDRWIKMVLIRSRNPNYGTTWRYDWYMTHVTWLISYDWQLMPFLKKTANELYSALTSVIDQWEASSKIQQPISLQLLFDLKFIGLATGTSLESNYSTLDSRIEQMVKIQPLMPSTKN